MLKGYPIIFTEGKEFREAERREKNEIWCGGLNDNCDSHYEPEVKPGRKDEEGRFFGTHIRETIKTLKDCFKK